MSKDDQYYWERNGKVGELENRYLGMERRYAKCESTEIMFEDHGFVSMFMHMGDGSWGQGFGGYVWGYNREFKKRVIDIPLTEVWVMAGAMDAMRKIMHMAGVQKWEDLKGKEFWIYRQTGLGKIHMIEGAKTGRRFDIVKHHEDWSNSWKHVEAVFNGFNIPTTP